MNYCYKVQWNVNFFILQKPQVVALYCNKEREQLKMSRKIFSFK